MNMPNNEELMALWEQGGFDAIAKHATAAADQDCQQILRDALRRIDHIDYEPSHKEEK
jgi:hypothetical protein